MGKPVKTGWPVSRSAVGSMSSATLGDAPPCVSDAVAASILSVHERGGGDRPRAIAHAYCSAVGDRVRRGVGGMDVQHGRVTMLVGRGRVADGVVGTNDALRDEQHLMGVGVRVDRALGEPLDERTSPPATIASAAARSKLPAIVANRWNTARSIGSSSSYDHDTVACRVRCRSTAVRPPAGQQPEALIKPLRDLCRRHHA